MKEKDKEKIRNTIRNLAKLELAMEEFHKEFRMRIDQEKKRIKEEEMAKKSEK